MLQIIKKIGCDGYEEILSSLGLGDMDVSISEAVDGETVNGYGIYRITPDEITVYKVYDGGDLMLCDGIFRSILFLAAMKGVEKAVLLNGTDEPAKKLRLLKDGNVIEPVSEIFGGCDSCKQG